MPGGVIAGTHLDKFAAAFWAKVKLKFESQNLSFDEKSYTKRCENVKFKCQKHGNLERQAGNLINSAFACPKCSKENPRKLPSSLEEFVEAAEKVHGDLYDYPNQEFIAVSRKLRIVCKLHGEYQQTGVLHISGAGCKRCNLAKGTLRYTTETFIEKAREVHAGRGYDYSKTEYKSGHQPIIVICPVHGEYQPEAAEHLSGSECNDCKNFGTRLTTKDFIRRAKETHGSKYLYDKTEYVYFNEALIITCPKHGDFEQRASGHLKGSGCRRCAAGSNSRKAVQWLEYMQVQTGLAIEHSGNGGEHYIEEIMPGKTRADIRVDGYNAETRTVFEFMGDSYHGNPKRYSEKMDEMHWCVKGKTYRDLYDATVRRTSWLRSIKYSVIEIWEMDWDRAVKAVVKIQRAFRKNHRTLS